MSHDMLIPKTAHVTWQSQSIAAILLLLSGISAQIAQLVTLDSIRGSTELMHNVSVNRAVEQDQGTNAAAHSRHLFSWSEVT